MSISDDDYQRQRWRSYLVESETGELMLDNLYGLRDPEALRAREYLETSRRAVEIQLGKVEIPRTGDWAEWRGIHRHLFGGIYPWAGHPRQVRMWKADKEFLRPHDYVRFLPQVFARIQSTQWERMRRPEFIDTAARLYMDLNWAHPFREGNGRTMRLFLERITSTARWRLDFGRVDPTSWDAASHHSRHSGYHRPSQPGPLLHVFSQISVVRDSAPDRVLDRTDPGDLEQIITRTLAAAHTPDPAPAAPAGADIGAAIHATGITATPGSAPAPSAPAHSPGPAPAPPDTGPGL